MTTYLWQDEVTLETHVCGKCGITFAAPDSFWKERHRTHQDFYCPNGHSRVFLGETPEQRAKRLEAQLVHERDQHRAEAQMLRRSLTATKGVVTRTKRRIARGVCPCCKRTFANVARHMTGQHPGYVEGAP